MGNEHTNGDISAAIEAGRELGERSLKEICGVPFIILPQDHTAKLYPELLEHPQRTEQSVSMHTAPSFIEYFNRFCNDSSAIFCNIDEASFIGVIDYHREDEAQWCSHRVSYRCKQTKEWTNWKASSGKKMNQIDFAYFIEENLLEIIEPAGAQMLEIATTLKAKTKLSFTSAKRLSDGQTQFQYVEEMEGSAGQKGNINIPETLKLGMRLFEGGDGYELEAKFRYRISEGNVLMWYDLVRPHKVHQSAVESIYDQIKEQADCDFILHGEAVI